MDADTIWGSSRLTVPQDGKKNDKNKERKSKSKSTDAQLIPVAASSRETQTISNIKVSVQTPENKDSDPRDVGSCTKHLRETTTSVADTDDTTPKTTRHKNKGKNKKQKVKLNKSPEEPVNSDRGKELYACPNGEAEGKLKEDW